MPGAGRDCPVTPYATMPCGSSSALTSYRGVATRLRSLPMGRIVALPAGYVDPDLWRRSIVYAWARSYLGNLGLTGTKQPSSQLWGDHGQREPVDSE